LALLAVSVGVHHLYRTPGDNLTMSLPVAVKLDAPIHDADGGTSAHFEKRQGNLRFSRKKGAFLSGSVLVVLLIFRISVVDFDAAAVCLSFR
jgi:hypothetical protein